MLGVELVIGSAFSRTQAFSRSLSSPFHAGLVLRQVVAKWDSTGFRSCAKRSVALPVIPKFHSMAFILIGSYDFHELIRIVWGMTHSWARLKSHAEIGPQGEIGVL